MPTEIVILTIVSFVLACLIVATAVFFSHRREQAAYGRGHEQGAIDFLNLIIASGFAMKVKAFKALNARARKGGIAFVGDSITQDFPVAEFFPGRDVYNRGIGGDTSEGLLKRLDESVFELEPKTVVLLIGTNDLALLDTTPAAIAGRIGEAVQTIHARLPETKIVLEAVYPVNPKVDPGTVGKRRNEDIRALNALLARIPDVTFVDLTAALVDAEGNFDRRYTIEGLHMNMEGYAIVTERICDIIIYD